MSPSPPSVQLPPPPLPLPPRVQPRQILFLALRQLFSIKTGAKDLRCIMHLRHGANRLDRSNEFLEESSCIINDIASSNFANMAIEKITDAQHDQNIVYGNNG
uniref:Chitin-binding lectin 1-like n=1 Tax=Populus alba TaxID=43335 RepID=A0A4U5PQ71_POPAL|nr:chitin-binding lectin 1-like [Populus alba]